MGQRVNIHYSIDIEELPSTVASLLNGALSQLSATGKEVEGALEPDQVLTLSTVTNIADLRNTLQKIDHALGDVSTLIKSYIQYQTSDSQPESQPADEPAIPANPMAPHHDVTKMPPAADLDMLKERLNHFRQNMNTPSETTNNDEIPS